MESFHNLPEMKRDAVLNAAFSCFARSGYKKTSMADIAEKAGISKASLFHYFGSKQDLYLYLFDFSVNAVNLAVAEGMGEQSDDFFVRIQQAMHIKVTVLSRYAGMTDFLAARYTEDAPELRDLLERHNEGGTRDALREFFIGIDLSKFKPEVPVAMAINAVIWISEGYVRAGPAHVDADKVTQEISQYLEMLRRAFYKEEFLP